MSLPPANIITLATINFNTLMVSIATVKSCMSDNHVLASFIFTLERYFKTINFNWWCLNYSNTTLKWHFERHVWFGFFLPSPFVQLHMSACIWLLEFWTFECFFLWILKSLWRFMWSLQIISSSENIFYIEMNCVHGVKYINVSDKSIKLNKRETTLIFTTYVYSGFITVLFIRLF